jgi:hypothetical protein
MKYVKNVETDNINIEQHKGNLCIQDAKKQ